MYTAISGRLAIFRDVSCVGCTDVKVLNEQVSSATLTTGNMKGCRGVQVLGTYVYRCWVYRTTGVEVHVLGFQVYSATLNNENMYVYRCCMYRYIDIVCEGVHKYIETWKTGRVYRWGLRSRVKFSAVETTLPNMGMKQIQRSFCLCFSS